MKRNLSVKEIAKLAGVSAGTVDRVLHNRGNVSEKSRQAVEAILDKYGYKYNLHTSAISLRRSYRFLAIMPSPEGGEYWASLQNGIEKALKEYSDIKIAFNWVFYNQFDLYSFEGLVDKLPLNDVDAVIIGPTFEDSTLKLCERLDAAKLPYIFIDAVIPGASPIASYVANNELCGAMLCRILLMMIPENGEIAIFKMKRTGGVHSANSLARRAGMDVYLKQIGKSPEIIKEVEISMDDHAANLERVRQFLEQNPAIQGSAVLNSRGYEMADILSDLGADNIRTMSFDLTEKNIECLNNGSLDVVLCQRPERQGYMAVTSLLDYLLYQRAGAQGVHYMPVDIIMKENLPFYKEI